MATTTTGVKMTFTKDGAKFSKTLSGMNASTIDDAAAAEDFVNKYKGIVDGELTAANFITTAPVDVD